MIKLIIITLISLGILFSFIRLVKGPSLFDRIISLDVINIIIIGVISLLALNYNNSLYIDIAIIYSILAFIETIVFARVLEGEK